MAHGVSLHNDDMFSFELTCTAADRPHTFFGVMVGSKHCWQLMLHRLSPFTWAATTVAGGCYLRSFGLCQPVPARYYSAVDLGTAVHWEGNTQPSSHCLIVITASFNTALTASSTGHTRNPCNFATCHFRTQPDCGIGTHTGMIQFQPSHTSGRDCSCPGRRA